MPDPIATKGERFAEFLRRLGGATAASNHDEAFHQVCDVLDAVEDDMTSIPNDPANWMTDGRMYPPQLDNVRSVKGRPDLKRYVSRAHRTFIRDNGAIEIRDLKGKVVFAKLGGDGQPIGKVEGGP